MLVTSSSSFLYCRMMSPTVFPGTIAATLCHRSGVSSSYIANPFSKALFCSTVQRSVTDFELGKYDRMSIFFPNSSITTTTKSGQRPVKLMNTETENIHLVSCCVQNGENSKIKSVTKTADMIYQVYWMQMIIKYTT